MPKLRGQLALVRPYRVPSDPGFLRVTGWRLTTWNLVTGERRDTSWEAR